MNKLPAIVSAPTAGGVPTPFVVATLGHYLSPGQVLVDVGCGPGLYRSATAARFIGIDHTAEPYRPDWHRDVDAVAEASRLPLCAGAADMIMCKSAFYAFPAHEAALAEFRRVLKPGGRIMLFDYNRRTQCRLERSEGAIRPCWTQWQLRDRVRAAGFERVEILLPTHHQLPIVLRLPLLVAQELLGTWAIVTGIVPT